MVERLPYKRLTSGSNPSTSTKKRKIVLDNDEKIVVRSFLDLFPGDVVMVRDDDSGRRTKKDDEGS